MTGRVNHQLLLERELARIEASGRRPRLLLHSCCAPCSSYCMEYLTRWFDLVVYYYNPNISPVAEFEHRLAELRRLVAEMPLGSVEIIPGVYDPERFFEIAKGLEHAPEGGERCERCFRLRLESAAEKARELGCDYFTTTLTISPLKDAQKLNAIGGELSEAFGVPWLPSDFKKRNGYKRSCELSTEYGLYRQDYCGCVFSKRERDRRNGAQ